jgi:hypothetical protein
LDQRHSKPYAFGQDHSDQDGDGKQNAVLEERQCDDHRRRNVRRSCLAQDAASNKLHHEWEDGHDAKQARHQQQGEGLPVDVRKQRSHLAAPSRTSASTVCRRPSRALQVSFIAQRPTAYSDRSACDIHTRRPGRGQERREDRRGHEQRCRSGDRQRARHPHHAEQPVRELRQRESDERTS